MPQILSLEIIEGPGLYLKHTIVITIIIWKKICLKFRVKTKKRGVFTRSLSLISQLLSQKHSDHARPILTFLQNKLYNPIHFAKRPTIGFYDGPIGLTFNF